jgi:hypothetical protein
MSFLTQVRDLPAFVRLRAKGEFDSAGDVSLKHWWKLDIATGWCEWRWRQHGRKYRRRVFVSATQARFEFAHETDVLAFRLLFG